MRKILKGGYFMAGALALVLLVSIACSKAEEPAAAPAATAKAAPVPTATTVAPAKARPTHWKWALSEDPTINFDPLQPGGAVGALNAQDNIYDQLIEDLGPELTTQGVLAETWEFVNPTKMRFKLRKGVKWHNGDPFTAEDVKYSLDAVTSGKIWFGKAFGSEVKLVTVVDSHTVDIEYNRPFGPVMYYTKRAGRIGPKNAREAAGLEAFKFNPVGTGAYKFVSVQSGQKVELQANDSYFLGPVFPPRLSIFWIREATTRAAAQLAGTVDLVDNIPHEELPRLRKAGGIQVIQTGGKKARWHTNTGDEPFSNELLRKAVNYAMDKHAIVDGLLEGRGSIDAGTFVKGNMGYDPNLKPYPYDPAKAKALLKEAGLEGLSFEFLSTSGHNPKDREIAQLAVSLWETVGLKPQIKYITREQVWETRDTRTFSISHCCQWGSTPDVDGEINWDYLDIGERAGRPLYGDTPIVKELYAMWQEQRGIVDQAERERIFLKMNHFIYDHALTVFTHSFNFYITASEDLGYVPYPKGSYLGYFHYDRWSVMGLEPVKVFE